MNASQPIPAKDSYRGIKSDDQWITSSTGKIFIKDSKGGDAGSGSGFNIGNGYFLTAGHCIVKNFDEQKSYIQFERGKNPSKKYKLKLSELSRPGFCSS